MIQDRQGVLDKPARLIFSTKITTTNAEMERLSMESISNERNKDF